MTNLAIIVIAVISATLSLIAIGWNVALHFLSFPKVKVQASKNFLIDLREDSEDSDEEFLVITATNIRSRQVVIEGFRGIKKTGEHFLVVSTTQKLTRFCSPTPCTLKEGEQARMILPLTGAKFNADEDRLYVTDTCGRSWYAEKPHCDGLVTTKEKLVVVAKLIAISVGVPLLLALLYTI